MATRSIAAAIADAEPPQGPGLATVREAEQYLNISRAKLYAMMEAGELAYIKLGKSRRIRWSALRALVDRHEHTGAAS
jgi:excisionase family DNA binding protein